MAPLPQPRRKDKPHENTNHTTGPSAGSGDALRAAVGTFSRPAGCVPALACPASAGIRRKVEPEAARWVNLCEAWLSKRFALTLMDE